VGSIVDEIHKVNNVRMASQGLEGQHFGKMGHFGKGAISFLEALDSKEYTGLEGLDFENLGISAFPELRNHAEIANAAHFHK
jgi:hypothetical protein